MSLYERNSIQYVNNEEVVYVSYPCDDDNEYDHLLLSNISKVAIATHNIEMLDMANCHVNSIDITFECEFNKNIDNKNIYLYACKDDFRAEPAKIELQDFVDSLAESVYRNDNFENIDKIIEARQEAILNFKNDIFKATAQVSAGYVFDFVGRVIDKNENTITIINNFETSVKFGNIVFQLNDCVSYMPLKDIDAPKIEFIAEQTKFVINSFVIESSTEGMFRHYKIIVKSAYVEETTESPIAMTETDIINEDLFFDERVKLLSDRSEVFNSNSSSNDIEDMFSDFEF